mgnify:CR=1 FL=1
MSDNERVKGGIPPWMAAYVDVARQLSQAGVTYIVIGVGGANFHTLNPSDTFETNDLDLLLPLDSRNLARAGDACDKRGFHVEADEPRRVVAERCTTRAARPIELAVDLTLEVAAFEFDELWAERRTFLVDKVEIPVAKLSQIIRSKAATNRERDRRFLAAHADRLRQMLDGDEI